MNWLAPWHVGAKKGAEAPIYVKNFCFETFSVVSFGFLDLVSKEICQKKFKP